MTSFPKRSCFHKFNAAIVSLLTLASIIIIALKVCYIASPSESDLKVLQTKEDIDKFVSTYFLKLHILHAITLICVIYIIILGTIDLVPKIDEHLKYGFHFISAFVIIIAGLMTLYSSNVAYNKPCSTSDKCCSLNRPSLTVFDDGDGEKDGSMIAVTILNFVAGIMLLITAIFYFTDTRKEAKESGYLTRIHNSGYTKRDVNVRDISL